MKKTDTKSFKKNRKIYYQSNYAAEIRLKESILSQFLL